jgi:hypothetical protein
MPSPREQKGLKPRIAIGREFAEKALNELV